MKQLTYFLVVVVMAAMPSFAVSAQGFDRDEYGTRPLLESPDTGILPTVKVAPVVGWRHGAMPHATEGFRVQSFARGLVHPRWLYVLPNGDILVAETNAPPKPEDGKGIKGWFMKEFMKEAGSVSQSANRITLLRDVNGDGIADAQYPFLQNLNSPFGMTLSGGFLYVANTDAIVRVPYADGDTVISRTPENIFDLPAGPINHHWTKDVIASRDGKKLYATVGSNSNVAENGMAAEAGRAAVWEIDLKTRQGRVLASGLRNPNGLSWQPQSGELWVVVNERDELGDKLVPDYMTSVRAGAFYGWPYSWYGQNIDERVEPQRPDLVKKAIAPDYALGAHTASLGLTFYSGDLFPPVYKNGAFIGQHGSWNRNKPTGYRVIFVPFHNGVPDGMPQVFLDGFLNEKGEAQGRPVGVAIDRAGALLVADDVGNTVWRVSPLPSNQ